MLKMFEFNMKFRCFSKKAKIYLSDQFINYVKRREKFIPIFLKSKFEDLFKLFEKDKEY